MNIDARIKRVGTILVVIAAGAGAACVSEIEEDSAASTSEAMTAPDCSHVPAEGSGSGSGSYQKIPVDKNGWPLKPGDLYKCCNLPFPNAEAVYEDGSFTSCGTTRPIVDPSKDTCGSKVFIHRSNCPDNDVCEMLAHESCHVAQFQRLCDGCSKASQHPPGTLEHGIDVKYCTLCSDQACGAQMESECYAPACATKNQGCGWLGEYCGEPKRTVDSVCADFPSLACNDFSQRSCACGGNLPVGWCTSGDCEPGMHCASDGTSCGCIPDVGSGSASGSGRGW